MRIHKVYLDNCCFNRPYDNQTNLLIRLETEAKIFIQKLVLEEKLLLVWSFILFYENNDNPFTDIKEQIGVWEGLAYEKVVWSIQVEKKALDLKRSGLHTKDAYHIASAISGEADYFVTTDKKILNKKISGIVLVNPIDFVREVLSEN